LTNRVHRDEQDEKVQFLMRPLGHDILVAPSPGHPSQADPRVRGRRMQYQLSRVVMGPALYVLGRPRVTGLEYVPASGPAILASNHLSFIDSMYLPLVIPRPVVFPAKAEYFSAKGPLGRLWAAYLRSTNQLEIDRSDSKSAQATLEAAAGILRAGNLFGFYPEGTRSPDGRLYRGRAGLGWLALNTGAPVIPVAMLGTRKMLPPGAPLPRPTRIEIKIGKPLEFGHLASDPPAKARRTIADEVMHVIADLSGQEYVHEYASDVKARLGG
jgi:1-acyl-sn-glycerol-3-phosphate acyltransferase